MFRLLLVLDAPNNCFPSAHVAIPAIMAVALARAYRRWQGIVSAAIGWWIAKTRVVPQRRVEEEPFGSS